LSDYNTFGENSRADVMSSSLMRYRSADNGMAIPCCMQQNFLLRIAASSRNGLVITVLDIRWEHVVVSVTNWSLVTFLASGHS